jgi:copper chaperone
MPSMVEIAASPMPLSLNSGRAHWNRSLMEDTKMIEFEVEGMSCQHCVAAVTKAVRALDASAKVQVNLEDGLVRVESDEAADRLGAAIADAGYTVKRTTPSASGGR